MLKRVERQVQAPVQALLVRLLGPEAKATKKSVFQLHLPHFILQARSCCNWQERCWQSTSATHQHANGVICDCSEELASITLTLRSAC